jgi:GLPGLI family protein
MKYFLQTGLFLMLIAPSTALKAQQVYGEGTVTYNIVVNTGNNETKAADLLDGATQKIFFKGVNTRTELSSILGKTITLHDSRLGNAVVMNEYGEQKILIRMTKDDYEDRNGKYAGIQFEYLPETKKILGYNCKLAIAKLKDGSTFRVYYTTDLVFQNKDYGAQFKNLPGFPLEYESELGKMKVTCIADKVSFDPVPAAMFDTPKTGYREMTYKEIKDIRKNK